MIPAPNYTQIPNLLLDTLMMDLSHLELKILLFICRKTFGWHKIRDHISLSQFEKFVDVKSRSHLCEALDRLQEKGMIKKTQEGNQSDGTLKNYYELIITQCPEGTTPPVPEQAPPPVPPRAPTKETPTKEKKIVCPTPPVGALALPKIVKKFGTDGKEESLELDEVYRRAIGLKKDWLPAEIVEVWQILCSYEGRVNDLWKFLEGTIEKLRKKVNFEKMNPKKKENKECQLNLLPQKIPEILSPDLIKRAFQTAGLRVPT